MKKSLALLAAACTMTLALSFGAAAESTGKTDLVIAMDNDIDTLHPTRFFHYGGNQCAESDL